MPDPEGPASAQPLAETTYFWERIRAVFTGLIEIIWQPGAAVALLIAIRYYDAGTVPKSLISGSGFIGFLLTPLTLSLFAHSRWPIHRSMATLFLITGGLLAAIPFAPSLAGFVALATLAHIVMVQYTPLYTEMYGTHFTTEQRGHRIGTVFILVGAVTITANLIVGELLDIRLDYFRPYLVLAAFCCLGSAWCLSHIPCKPLQPEKVGNPLKNLGLPVKDRLFGWMLISWMLLGFGNLMTLPLRTEYMANPRFGINASNQTILFITGAVPLLFRLLASRALGRLFDRWNLITLRLFLNSLFLVLVLIFFNTRNLWLLGVSMAFLGTAMAGGKITWSLWVTKLAPPGQASAYMSIHMLSTGIRGSIAPFVGFALIDHMEPRMVGFIGIGLMIASTLMFLPARPHMAIRTREVDAMALNPNDD